MWVEIGERGYDHVFPSRAMQRYEPGRRNLKRDVAEAAIAKGRAVAIGHPEDLKSTKAGGVEPRG